jgi:hypothetical protein
MREDTSLLRTVFAKTESVLLARNLKSYSKLRLDGWITLKKAYSDEKVSIKIGALCVFLVSILDSSSLDQINALYEQ